MDRNAQSHPPLKAVVLHILMALAEGDAHGYGIMQRVRESSEGRVPLESGTFYRHLKKLIDVDLVEESDERPGGDDPRRGAYYRVTDQGRALLAAEIRRLRHVVAMSSRLDLAGEEGSA